MANNPFFLKRSSDFLSLRERGKTVRPVPWLLLNYMNNQSLGVRVGFTVPKKVGSAVIRNRLKRLTREWARKETQKSKDLNVDINFVFRPMPEGFYRTLPYQELVVFFMKGFSELQRRL